MGYMKNFLIAICILFTSYSFTQDKRAYVIYNSQGKKVSYNKMLKDLSKQDLVFFGEEHNSAIAHWLQLEVSKDLDKSRDLVLGAEMYETDNQDELDLYLKDSIDQKGLDTLARLWHNNNTDYKPLLDYAKENNLTFVAANVPRRYAKMVNYNGFGVLDTLNIEDKSYIAPLPIPFDSTITSYQSILVMMGEHGTMNLVRAQALKDATMAHSILKYYKEGSLFLHYNGKFHSDIHEGIVWYINEYKPGLNIKTISTVTQANISKLDSNYLDVADFIICVDEDMTTTY